ncbi:MAG: thioredoxin-disulfide reductase [Candidatus Nanoarchaeia archaeon]|nr:thioredoxin-disulfide reductase [Candidatus Haiyanarchaeum thermophilum]MCW1303168.1 thioredoxin-disulfide reductase [Candidatus Haiyanarchaeum thermophilum]MCW1303833.1 thioredoxin-disulfide reductase [Candidatus Haiyanarchaeum thermophilum]MCW1306550.1 thioredoxin-disulfide reductase [Candidatus Haiyanarchaeum thermophilum]MCW1306964.1 thioredoxin-disulfide reductase [Candidatus Haiyanarchaeum thermophilum]
MSYDTIIIGGGAAGCTAAIYSARRNLKTLLIEEKAIGGLLLLATTIENYPGFESISGFELASRLEKQVKNLPVEIVIDKVVEVRKEEEVFLVFTSSGKMFEGKSVIIASGVTHKELGISGEEKFVGKGISYCATCDAPLFKGKTVAVVGGGNSAFHYALLLAELCSKVYLIHRRKEFRAEEVLVERLRRFRNVEFKVPYLIVELYGEKFLSGIKIRNVESGEDEKLKLDGLFIAIGQVPNIGFLSKLNVQLDENNFIKVDERMRTNITGLFAAGDVTGIAQQLVVACAQGAIAAISASKFLKEGQI